MSLIETIQFENVNVKKIKDWSEQICLLVSNEDFISPSYIREIDNFMYGGLIRILKSKEFDCLSHGENILIPFPVGLNAKELQIIKIEKSDDLFESRLAGGSITTLKTKGHILIITSPKINVLQILYGFFLKVYEFNQYKTHSKKSFKAITVAHLKFDSIKQEFKFFDSLLKGIYLCRDLVNEPANILNTDEFANRLEALESYGLKVDVLNQEDLEEKGMRALLAVGQGSICPSKVVVIRWQGQKKDNKPLILVGKGVVFDSGGISLKSANGMEEMTMDMGGAGVVAGTMKALALRQCSANVIGLIGLVENMPDGGSQRPGDVVKTMKGDTVEVINTDAEGRLVLCDLLWFAQTQFAPKAIIDLATLTGAIVVALGSQNAGIFSNNNDICKKFLIAAKLEGEGAWRLPLHPNYKKLLKSRIADLANVGGRAAGSITAAQFLENFIADNLPWIHIDIAGVTFSKNSSSLSPQGATGWGVATLNRLIHDHFEKSE